MTTLRLLKTNPNTGAEVSRVCPDVDVDTLSKLANYCPVWFDPTVTKERLEERGTGWRFTGPWRVKPENFIFITGAILELAADPDIFVALVKNACGDVFLGCVRDEDKYKKCPDTLIDASQKFFRAKVTAQGSDHSGKTGGKVIAMKK